MRFFTSNPCSDTKRGQKADNRRQAVKKIKRKIAPNERQQYIEKPIPGKKNDKTLNQE